MSKANDFALTWDLDVLYPHPASDAFRDILTEFERDLSAVADESDRLPPIAADNRTVADWTRFLRAAQTIDARNADLNSFIGCHAAAEAENKLFQQLEGRLAALNPHRERIYTNIELALKDADDEALAKFIAADEFLTQIAFLFHDRKRMAELRLPKALEGLASDLAVDGLHAWGRLYDRLSGALKIKVMERGEVVEKSPGQVMFDSPERSIRQNNFYAADKAWATIADTCADAINHIAGYRLTKYRHLGLKDHLEAPLRYNRMRRETLDAMWEVVARRKGVLVDYFKKKAELLGVDRLAWYDQAAPLPSQPGAQPAGSIGYDDACTLVIDTFSGFTSEFGDFAKRSLRERWVEVENRPGKRQGGFCTGFPHRGVSRIFMTFRDTVDSMSTLAHELGHAYHSDVLADQPFFLQDYPMNLAETASTFAEAVLGEARLKRAANKAEELSILDGMLGDSVAFLMNIHARFLFENSFHVKRAGGELTSAELSDLMLAAQKEAYLDAFADDGWNPRFWVSKLHFYISHLPFYNFPYTFGYLLSLGVYAAAGEMGSEFPAKYRRLLIATGCQDAETAVKSSLGYDLAGPEFWEKSLEVVAARVARYLELAS